MGGVGAAGFGLLTPWGVLEPESLSDTGRVDALIATQRLVAPATNTAAHLANICRW